MIHENIELTGSFTVSGSFVLPSHPSSSAVYETGSLYHDSVDGILKVYTGTQWVTVGEQTASASPAASANIEYLLVAGGGGGGSYGGGGAGGYLSSSLSTIESGSSITVNVGAGGAGSGNSYSTEGSDGVDSSIASAGGTSFTTVTSIGGGGGGDNLDGANDGGSGGGGSDGPTDATGGSGTVGQGNVGGSGTFTSSPESYQGGGGGGAGTAGGNASQANGGNGGNGLPSNITGTSVTRAGGGGGVVFISGHTPGTAGSGGGGAGGSWNTNTSAISSATAGTANSGSGGGSGQGGGSGVAIFAYDSGSFSGLGGIKTTRSDGYMVHTFNSSGTLSIAGAGEYPVANGSVFAPILYSGDGTTSKAITGVGFQPDLIWIKNRDANSDPIIQDTVRGITKMLETDGTAAESNNSVFGHVNSVESDGFTVDDGGSTEENANKSGRDYVAWCWKAGGTAVSNTDGTIASTVSANQDAGFSIVKYNSGATAITVGHGLSQKPEMLICKPLVTGAWAVWHKDMASDLDKNYIPLTNAAVTPNASSLWNYSNWGTTKIGSNNPLMFGNSNDVIAYCFHSVDGYQKVGSYTASSGDDVVTTGFKPRFVMLKRTDSAGHWEMHDAVRFPSLYDENGASKRLRANDSSAEALFNNSPIFFTDTGFTLDSSVSGDSYGDYDANGGTFIYLAIA